MRRVIMFSIVTAILLLNWNCNREDKKPNNINNLVTSEVLNSKKQEILQYVSGFTCSATIACKYLAFGKKSCGGPQEYLVFPENIDLNYLTIRVNQYNALEDQYNIDNNIASDCMVVQPPTNVSCINGNCKIIK